MFFKGIKLTTQNLKLNTTKLKAHNEKDILFNNSTSYSIVHS